MKKFLALYMIPAAAIAKMGQMSQEEREKEMGQWKEWMDSRTDVFVDQGGPLGKNKRVTFESVTDTSNEVGGYSIVQAESHEAATAIFSDIPGMVPDGAYVEVMEIVSM